MSHSKLPWKINEWDEDSPSEYAKMELITNEQHDIAYISPWKTCEAHSLEAKANADLIVKAVNNYERLLVLATKHCPSDHKDFKEIINIAEDIK